MSITANAIYHAEALSLLERLDEEVAKLVYLDPPWYPNDARVAGNDAFKQHLDLLSKIIQQSLRVLTKDGSVIFHSDVRLSSTFRLMLDQVFQPDHFVAEYIFPNPVRARVHHELSGHSVLLRYSKTHNYILNRETRPLSEKDVQSIYRDRDERGRYRLTDLIVPLSRQSGSVIQFAPSLGILSGRNHRSLIIGRLCPELPNSKTKWIVSGSPVSIPILPTH